MDRNYYWRMGPDEAYGNFLRMAEKAVETNARTPPTGKERIYQHEMFVKFAYHIASIMTLERGSAFSIDDARKTAYDYSSVMVLFRAALETYLAYFYVFCDASDQDERTLRFHNWMSDGVNMRQKVDVSFSADLQLKKAMEAADIFTSITRMQSTDAFHKLSPGQQHLAVARRKWLRPGWADIFVKTGMSAYWARIFYALFSAYAHSSSLSIMQFKEATAKNEGKQLTGSFCRLIFAVCALFTDSYTNDFALAGALDEREIEMLEAWTWLAKNMQTPEASR